MKRITKYAVIAAVAASATANVLFAAPADIAGKATLDSTEITMGYTTALNVEFTGNIPARSVIEVAQYPGDSVEITAPSQSPRIVDLGNNRRQLTQRFTVQSFDSGMYRLPAIYLLADTDTIFAQSPVLKVIPCNLDSANNVVWDEEGNPVDLKINPYSDVTDMPKKFVDYIPDWLISYWLWILIGLLVIGIALFVYLKWLRHGRIPLMPVKKPIPPYDLAKMRLTKLHDMKLWQKGSEKEYYTQLTDILRQYLHGRFAINAREMTSRQIRHAIKSNPELKPLEHLIDPILTQADFVKFAKARLSADENESAYSSAVQFVDVTRPAEQAPDEKTADDDNSQNSKKKDN